MNCLCIGIQGIKDSLFQTIETKANLRMAEVNMIIVTYIQVIEKLEVSWLLRGLNHGLC